MGQYDYRGQLERNSVTQDIAKDLFHAWIGAGNEDLRVVEFGTLTSRVSMPMDFWQRVTTELFIDIYQDELGSTGMYSFEQTTDGQIHCHFVAVRETKYTEFLKSVFQVWKANVGFFKVEYARNILNVAGYTVKEWVDGETKDRAIIQEPLFFGPGWGQRTREYEWTADQVPTFE